LNSSTLAGRGDDLLSSTGSGFELSSFGGTGSSACDSLDLPFPLEAKIIHNATKIRSAPTTEPTAIPTFAPVPSPLFDDALGIADEVVPAN
jgi:hypothetical protein